MSEQLDNGSFAQKVRLRNSALRQLSTPTVVMETNGGIGALWRRCYADVENGCVCEIKAEKAAILAQDRPTWAVYECDVVRALAGGAGGHLMVNFLDCDPYGSPWDILDSWFNSSRPRAHELVIVVTDGLRQKLRLKTGWDTRQMHGIITRIGNDRLYSEYLSVAKELMSEKASRQGYWLRKWAGYYCGSGKQMTHYAACLDRR